MQTSLKESIKQEMIASMKAKNKQRLTTIRSITAAIKQFEVDKRQDPDEQAILSILNKLSKQRIDSMEQYTNANRQDLADIERYELSVIKEFLPEQLNETEIHRVIAETIQKTGAKTPQDMGKVMVALKTELTGKADLGVVSKLVKASLK